MNRLKWCFVLCLTSFLLSGCWDRLELEDRALVLALSIDEAEEQADEEESNISHKRESFVAPKKEMIRITAQIAVPGRIPLGPEKGGERTKFRESGTYHEGLASAGAGARFVFAGDVGPFGQNGQISQRFSRHLLDRQFQQRPRPLSSLHSNPGQRKHRNCRDGLFSRRQNGRRDETVGNRFFYGDEGNKSGWIFRFCSCSGDEPVHHVSIHASEIKYAADDQKRETPFQGESVDRGQSG